MFYVVNAKHRLYQPRVISKSLQASQQPNMTTKESQLLLRQYFTFGLLWLTYCLVYFLRKPLGVIKPELSADLGLTKNQMGWLDVALMLPYSGIQIACSGLWDHVPIRQSCALCVCLASVFMLCLGLQSHLYLLCCCIFLSGSAQAPIWPLITKVLSSWYPEERMSSVFGYMSTSSYVGALLGTGLAIYVQGQYGWKFVFVPSGIVGILISFILICFLRLPAEVNVDVPGRERQKKMADLSEQSGQGFWHLWSITGVQPVTIAVFCLKFVRYCMYMWLPLYLIEHLHYDKTQGGLFSTAFDIGGILGGPVLGIVVDKYFAGDSLKGIYFNIVIGAISFWLITAIASWGTIYCSLLLLVAGATNSGADALLTGSIPMMIGEKFGQNQGAGVTSLVNGLGSIGGIIEGPIIGLVSQQVGWGGVIFTMIIMSIAGAIAAKMASYHLKKVTAESPQRKEEAGRALLEKC